MKKKRKKYTPKYTPATARKQFEELLTSYAPEAYPDGSKAWYTLAGMAQR